MKIMSWNVQRIKKEKVVAEVIHFKMSYHLDLIFLIETMVDKNNTFHILPKLGFDKHDIVHPFHRTSGLWVLWSMDNILVNVLAKDNRGIHLCVPDK